MHSHFCAVIPKVGMASGPRVETVGIPPSTYYTSLDDASASDQVCDTPH